MFFPLLHCLEVVTTYSLKILICYFIKREIKEIYLISKSVQNVNYFDYGEVHECEFLFQVNQRVMHKYEQESKKLGKQSFMYAWVLDETGEERNRGITMDVGRFQFETKTKAVSIEI